MENVNQVNLRRNDAETRRRPATSRRGSMSEEEEKQRRASIKAIMADNSMSPHERRLSIQQLMDGRRTSISNSSSRCGTPPLLAGESDDASPLGANGLDFKHLTVSPISPNAPFIFPESAETCIPISNEQTKRAELTRPNCTHYVRKCTVVSPCCGATFGCRICHDDCPVLPPKVNNKVPRRYPRSASLPSSFTTMDTSCEDTHHNIDRFAIKEVICRECFTKQSSKTYVRSAMAEIVCVSHLAKVPYLTLFLFSLLLLRTGITVSIAMFNSGTTTATFAICGCLTTKDPTTAPIVAFAASVVPRISNTVMNVACALTEVCILITIARLGSTNPTAPCVKNICSAREVHHMKCRVDMPFTGTASDNWRHMILGVRSAKRRRKRENA